MTEEELLDYVLNAGSAGNTAVQGALPEVPTWSVTSVPGLALSPVTVPAPDSPGAGPYQGLLPNPYGSDYSPTGSQQPKLLSYQALLDQLVSQRQQAAKDLSAAQSATSSSMPTPTITTANP
jgi:hypothetical protein